MEINAVDALLSLCGHHLEVFRLPGGSIGVKYEDAEMKDGIFLIGGYGVGKTFDTACDDYLNKLRGKTLVFNAAASNRKEVTVL